MDKQLTRPQSDRMFLGVASGLANYFNIDPTIVRLLFAVSFFAGFGSPLLVYFILALVMRSDDAY